MNQMKTVFITGATAGIGRACAHAFARAGHRLIINGRRENLLASLQSELIETYDAEVYLLPFDVREKESVFGAVHQLPDEWKKIDLLINNAGLALGRELFDEAHLHDWETMVNTNVLGLLYVTKAVLPGMVKRKEGHVINIGSTAGDLTYEGGNVYCATKAAVAAISEGMRIDLLRNNIRVTNVKPGAVETEFSLVRHKGDAERATDTYKGFRPLTGDDVAEVILYCASLPPHMCINDLTLTPTAQANGIYLHRDG